MRNNAEMLRLRLFRWSALAGATLVIAISANAAASDSATGSNAPPGGTIGYLVTDLEWAVYETKDAKEECPDGLNVGPREQTAAQFPDLSAHSDLTFEQVVLKREASRYFPENFKESLPFREAQGKVAYGLNLDGKVGPHDFVSPDGQVGIDNQLYRAIGCVIGYRKNGFTRAFAQLSVKQKDYSRFLIEITGIHDMTNDPDVVVTTYRGLDPLVMDGADKPIAGRTERVDLKRGARFVHKLHGKIVDGVLITEPADLVFPWITRNGYQVASEEWVRDARLQLKLRPEGAEGLLAGYSDVESWYNNTMRQWGWAGRQNHITPAPLYQALHRLADAYPDSSTGANTAISGAIQVKFTQVFIQHPTEETATLVTSIPPRR
jgi:hypothetical protein